MNKEQDFMDLTPKGKEESKFVEYFVGSAFIIALAFVVWIFLIITAPVNYN